MFSEVTMDATNYFNKSNDKYLKSIDKLKTQFSKKLALLDFQSDQYAEFVRRRLWKF
jgi:hypothetical protein